MKRRLATTGIKTEVVSRLITGFQNFIPILEDATKSKAENMAGKGLTPGAHWEELVCEGQYVEEP